MDSINIEVVKLLGLIGIMTLAGVTGLIFWAIVEFIKEKIRVARIDWKIKHRFDGKPIAKCWCRDCRTYNLKTHFCSLSNQYKADNGFCDSADPIWKEKEEEKNNE